MKHTPGEWLRTERTVYSLMHHGWHKGEEQFKNRFSFYFQFDSEVPEEEREANILLAKAAPELLDALIHLVDNVDEGEFISITRIQEARAAIAKATGETS